MKIGMVCPYSWDVPGGVQQHVRDLAEARMPSAARAHDLVSTVTLSRCTCFRASATCGWLPYESAASKKRRP